MRTAFTDLVGCRVPIQQAGMGGTATVELAAAVADAGALGMVGMPMAGPGAVVAALERLSRQTSGAFGVNFLMPFLDRESVAAAASRARVVEFFYGDPDPSLVALAHDGGALASWQVGSVDEAQAARDAGCDFLVVQGVEAGGHVRGRSGLLALLDQVLGAVGGPVLAAGGIGTPRGVAAVLAAGAAGARVGTRFVAADEADSHPDYVDALVAAGPGDTVVTTVFSLQWPEAPHRVLRSCVDAASNLDAEVAADAELADGTRRPMPKFAPVSPSRRMTGHVEAMAQYAGESVGAVTRRQPAGTIVQELADGAEALLARWH
ncbi:MAG TPA: nitronate monooxygenase [Acidimicrobiales bacterium]|nr:nitronate monooxygenase [Acidimicrobiales bacterium]